MFILPASAKATTNGGEARKFAFTSWWTMPSKFLLPDRAEQTVKFLLFISSDTHSSNGPEFPIQVVQPYPTKLKPIWSRYFVRLALSK